MAGEGCERRIGDFIRAGAGSREWGSREKRRSWDGWCIFVKARDAARTSWWPGLGRDRAARDTAQRNPSGALPSKASMPITRFTPLLLVLFAPVAGASELYKCQDAAGNRVYSSTRAGYSNCRLIGNFPAAASTAPALEPSAAPAKPSMPANGTVEFRSAPAGSAPKSLPETGTAKVTRGAVYRYEHDGVTHYTNRKPAGQSAKVLFTYIQSCYACGVAPGVDWSSVALNTAAFAAEIATAAATHRVDEAFVRAIIHAESAFNPNALSHKGAQGLMQLMPATAERFGVVDAFSPADNIGGGVGYLAWLMKRFDGDTRRVAAAYNAGEGAVDKYGDVPPYEETQRFVERVGILHARYAGEIARRNVASADAP